MSYDSEFKFNPASLATKRNPGISAYMRIKNEQQFVRLAIESHLPFYDEIIACYNDCTDNTEAILLDLQSQHPDKIKVFHYLPKVVPYNTSEHANTSTESVHSFANHSNYALSKCSYSVAVKLDADHLAIPQNLAPAIATIRADIKIGIEKFYFFSGINVMPKGKQIMCGGKARYPFSGQGDIVYHPVHPRYKYIQRPVVEKFTYASRAQMPHVYLGLLYFHLNRLRKRAAKITFDKPVDGVYYQADGGPHIAMPFSEFCSPRNHTRIFQTLKSLNKWRHAVYRHAFLRKLKYRLSGQPPSMYSMRLIRLSEDLRAINFDRDLISKLRNA